MKTTFRTTTITMALLFGGAMASANVAAESDEKKGKRRGPPPIAFEACAEFSEGASCAFEGRRGEVEGTCIIPPGKETLVCAPEGGPRWKRKQEESISESSTE